MERIINYDKKFMLMYIGMLSILFFNILFNFIRFNNTHNISTGIIAILAIYILSILLSILNYFKNKNFYITFKSGILMVLAGILSTENLLLFGSALTCYITICIELIFVFSDKEHNAKRYMLIYTFFPIFMSIFINAYRVGVFDSMRLFFWIQYMLIFYGIYRVISVNKRVMLDTIENKTQLFESSEEANIKLNKITSEMYIQNELLRYISSTLEFENLMELVTDSIVGAMGADTCSIIIIQEDNKEYFINTKSNYQTDIVSLLKVALYNNELDDYLIDKSAHIDGNVDLDDYPFIENRPVGSLIILPLVNGRKIYGLIIAEHASVGFFGEDNLSFFQSIATQINIAVNNASLYKKMEDLASKDGLTGLYNRSYFQKMLNALIEKSKNENEIFCIVLFDIDHFKRVNDTYGHSFGDEAIKMVARITGKYAEENNGFAGRYGGEEFVMAFAQKDIPETLLLIEKMHQEIQNEVLFFEETKPVTINVSIGITIFPEFALTADGLLKRADNAMYYSKENGRGRITIDNQDL